MGFDPVKEGVIELGRILGISMSRRRDIGFKQPTGSINWSKNRV